MKRRWFWRALAGVGVLLLLFLGFVFVSGYRAFGKAAEGPRLAAMQRSPEWHNGGFVNPEPLYNDYLGMLTGLSDVSPDVNPKQPVPVLTPVLSAPIVTGLRVTWLGHSTTVVEIDGRRVLTDPVWNDRVSPLAWAGPLRWFAPLIPLDALRPVDAVVISHDHYDHLDMSTVVAMKDWDTIFVVPLGVGAHLAYWGIPEERIRELDWWQRTFVHGLEIVCVPARHASGRGLWDKDAKLWAGYALLGEKHRVYYSGDTGLFPAMRTIGKRFGPFDLTMIEVGQYNPAWPDWHLGPEQAVRAHELVRGKVMLPVHWGAFGLAYHAWTEPIERALAAGTAAQATLVAPRPGQPIEPETHPPLERWWPTLPGKTGAQDPIPRDAHGPMRMRPNWFFAFPLDGAFVLELPPLPKNFRRFHPEDVHLTLSFLGGVGEAAALRALAALDERMGATSLSSIEVSLGEVVPMGSPRRYSALSALLGNGRTEASDFLTAHRDLLTETAAGRREKRSAKPHVTLARPRGRATDDDRAAGIAWGASLDLSHVRARLDRIALYTWSESRHERMFRVVAERRLAP